MFIVSNHKNIRVVAEYDVFYKNLRKYMCMKGYPFEKKGTQQ